MGIEVAVCHLINIDLMAKRLIRFGGFIFTQAKIDIFIHKACSEALNFVIEPNKFLPSPYDCEVGIYGQSTNGCSPGTMLYVLEQVKVGEGNWQPGPT